MALVPHGVPHGEVALVVIVDDKGDAEAVSGLLHGTSGLLYPAGHFGGDVVLADLAVELTACPFHIYIYDTWGEGWKGRKVP
jgi:hypothetical protein